MFLWLIQIGYVLGVFYKLFFNYDYVIWLYVANLILIGADMFLYYKYKNLPDSGCKSSESNN